MPPGGTKLEVAGCGTLEVKIDTPSGVNNKFKDLYGFHKWPDSYCCALFGSLLLNWEMKIVIEMAKNDHINVLLK